MQQFKNIQLQLIYAKNIQSHSEKIQTNKQKNSTHTIDLMLTHTTLPRNSWSLLHFLHTHQWCPWTLPKQTNKKKKKKKRFLCLSYCQVHKPHAVCCYSISVTIISIDLTSEWVLKNSRISDSYLTMGRIIIWIIPQCWKERLHVSNGGATEQAEQQRRLANALWKQNLHYEC